MFSFEKYGEYGIDELNRDDFVYLAIVSKRFEIKGVGYEVIHTTNEGFNVTWDNGIDLGDEYCPIIADLISHLEKLFVTSTFMTVEEIRDALIAREDDCDRVMLASLYTTVGYINCGIDMGYEHTDREIAEFRQQLKDL